MIYKNLFIFVLAGFICSGCVFGSNSKRSCAGIKYQHDLDNCFMKFEVRKATYWKDKFSQPLVERVMASNDDTLAFMQALSEVEAKKYSPRLPSDKHRDEGLGLARKAIEKLPKSVRKLVVDDLAGIILLEDFGSSAFVTTILDNEKKIKGYFIILDPSFLNKKANEWASWREMTPFKEGEYSLDVKMVNDEKLSRIASYQYILLHEIGHIISTKYGYLPHWEKGLAKYNWTSKEGKFYAYTSWTMNKNGEIVLKHEIPLRKRLRYYDAPLLENKEMAVLYNELESIDFPALYGIKDMWEDFAESFANYVHVKHLGRPWEIKILKKGKEYKVFRHCWGKEICRKKENFMKKVIEGHYDI